MTDTTAGEGDLDLYDDKVQAGISWAMRQWGEALGLTTWTQGDGSESVEGDVGAEIHTILVDAGLRDPETNDMATLAAQPSAGAQGGAGLDVLGNIVWWKEGGVSFYPANDTFAVDRSCRVEPVVALSQAERERDYWIKRHASALTACVQAEIERDEATPAQPDTGDVAALREAFARIIDPAAFLFTSDELGTKDYNHPATEAYSKADRILAVLSKPNAPGREG